MASDILAEALARIEHKLDLLLKHHKVLGTQMHFPGQTCPVCNSPIDYQVDLMKGVVVRRCKCSTGKMAPSIPLLPVPTGVTNGDYATGKPAELSHTGEVPQDRRRR